MIAGKASEFRQRESLGRLTTGIKQALGFGQLSGFQRSADGRVRVWRSRGRGSGWRCHDGNDWRRFRRNRNGRQRSRRRKSCRGRSGSSGRWRSWLWRGCRNRSRNRLVWLGRRDRDRRRRRRRDRRRRNYCWLDRWRRHGRRLRRCWRGHGPGRYRRRNVTRAPVAIGGAAGFGIVGFGLAQMGGALGLARLKLATAIGAGMHGADEEDDAGRNGQGASHDHPGRTGWARRKECAQIGAIHPEQIAAARACECAEEKVENPHQHYAIPDHTRGAAFGRGNA